jgi:hypothetical protein
MTRLIRAAECYIETRDLTMATDMFDAAALVCRALNGFTRDEAKKAVQMALVARGMPELLVDPDQIRLLQPTSGSEPLTCGFPDEQESK